MVHGKLTIIDAKKKKKKNYLTVHTIAQITKQHWSVNPNIHT